MKNQWKSINRAKELVSREADVLRHLRGFQRRSFVDFACWFYAQLFKAPRFRENRGAIMLEYVLLLVACLGFAALIKSAVEISSSSEESGWVIQTWMSVINRIAEDM